MIDRGFWRAKWLTSINELTSIDLQKESWLDKNNTNPHRSFVEFTCCYFDDVLIMDDIYQTELLNNWITIEEYNTIIEWHELLRKYNPPREDTYAHKAILEDVTWQEVVQKGVDTKNKLIKILNEKERFALTRKIDHLKYQ